MKKHLTLLVAGAILAAIAGVASAKEAPIGPDIKINIGGHFYYELAYNANTANWTNDADQNFDNNGLKFWLDIKGTSTQPRLLVGVNGNGGFDSATFEHTVFGNKSLKLGALSADWDSLIATGTWGPGVYVRAPFTNLTLEAATTKSGGEFSDYIGAKASYKLNADGSNNVWGAVALDTLSNGGAMVAGTYKLAPTVTFNGKYATEVSTAKNPVNDSYVKARVDVVPGSAYSFYAQAYKVDAGFKPVKGKQSNDGGDRFAGAWDNAQWMIANGYADKLNLNGNVAYNLANGVGKLYADAWTKADDSYTFKAGLSYAPVKLSDAFVAKDTKDGSTEAKATFAVPVGIFNVIGAVGMKSFDTAGAEAQSYGLLKAETSTLLSGIYTYGQIEKGYSAEAPTATLGLKYELWF